MRRHSVIAKKEQTHKYGHLSRHSPYFRSRIIEEFQMLEGISDQGVFNTPIYNTSDINDKVTFHKIIQQNPNQLIKFKTYMKDITNKETTPDSYTSSLKSNKMAKIRSFAQNILSKSSYQNMGLVLIVTNTIILALSGELDQKQEGWQKVVRKMLDFLDLLFILVLFSDILLKWLDSFNKFWRCWWNIYDLVIISLTTMPVILSFIPSPPDSTLAQVTRCLMAMRIFRSLKLISRISGLKIIVLTLLEAFQSMVFILVLLFAVAYIFAIVAVSLFQPTKQPTEVLYFDGYYKSFNTLHNAILTLFQLFTLDQWYRVFRSAASVISDEMGIPLLIYFILWIWLGAFIFKNIIVGIIVENFEIISARLTNANFKEIEENENKKILSKWSDKLSKGEDDASDTLESVSNSRGDKITVISSKANVSMGQSSSVSDMQRECHAWQNSVYEYTRTLGMEPESVLWSRDNLFKYYQILEELMENLEEYQELERVAGKLLLKLFDKL